MLNEKREEIVIGETTFYVQKFSAMEQLRIFGDLQKTILPSIGKLFGGTPKADGEEGGQDSFGDALAQLSAKLDGNELIKLAKTLINPELVTVQRDDLNNGEDLKLRQDKFDMVFADMSEIIELIEFILRLNFTGFFTKYLTRLGSAQNLAEHR